MKELYFTLLYYQFELKNIKKMLKVTLEKIDEDPTIAKLYLKGALRWIDTVLQITEEDIKKVEKNE